MTNELTDDQLLQLGNLLDSFASADGLPCIVFHEDGSMSSVIPPRGERHLKDCMPQHWAMAIAAGEYLVSEEGRQALLDWYGKKHPEYVSRRQ